MLEKCPECKSLGGHTFRCKQVAVSIRAGDEKVATLRIGHVLEAWPRGLPRSRLPVTPSLAVPGLFFGSIYCLFRSIFDRNLLFAGGALALLLVVWLWARYSNGAKSINNLGLTFVGDNVHGGIITKWITIIVPIIPVRSFIVVDPSDDEDAFDLVEKYREGPDKHLFFSIIPLPGLGIEWEAVSNTYVTGLVIFVVIVVLATCQTFLER